jgi:ketosteroid isomerase-like protein
MFRRYFSVLLVAGLLLGGCGQNNEQAVSDTVAEKGAVRDVLHDYIASVETENMEDYATNIVHDQDMINFGAMGEPIKGWEGLQTVMAGQNEMLDNIHIDESDLRVHMSQQGDRAWATSLWQFHATAGSDTMTIPIRCTWILEKRNDIWKIVHFHKSVPMS